MIKVVSRPFLGREKYKVKVDRINEMYPYEPKEE